MTDRQVTVGLDLRNSGYNRGILESAALTRMFARDAKNAGSTLERDFDRHFGTIEKNFGRYTDRLKFAIDALGALGPALVPITGAAIPALTGLAAGLGVAAAAGGTLMLAFKGIGDAVTKVNKANINPTTANLKNANIAMQQLSKSGQDMVMQLVSLKGAFQELRNAAQTGMFPGLTHAIEFLKVRLPEVEEFVHKMGKALGELGNQGARSLAGPQWDEFFTFITEKAPKAALAMGQATGHLAHALAELTMAFSGLNGNFLDHFVSATEKIDKWAAGLSQTKGFQDFVAYLERTGPMVGDLLGSIAMALANIVEAAAPIGEVWLKPLTSFFDIISKIADSDFGTPLIGLLSLTKVMALWTRLAQTKAITGTSGFAADLAVVGRNAGLAAVGMGKFNSTLTVTNEQMSMTGREMALLAGRFNAFRTGGLAGLRVFNASVTNLGKTIPVLARNVGTIGLMTVAFSGLGDKIGLTNTVMGASIGLMGGPWGAAIGAGIGLLMDLTKGQESAAVAADQLTDSINAQTGAMNAQGYAKIGEAFGSLADDAKKAGIPLSDIISAAVKGGDAIHQLGLRFQEVIDADTTTTEGGSTILGDKAEAASRLSKALVDQNGEVKKAIGLAKGRQAGLDAAAEAERRAAAATSEHEAAVMGLNDAIGRELTGIKALNGLLSEREATLAYNQSLLDLKESIKDNGEVWDKTSAKGIANWQALDSVASNAESKLDNLQKRGKDAQAQNFFRQVTSDLRDFVKMHPEAAAAARDIIDTLDRKAHGNVFANTLADLHKFKAQTPQAADAVKAFIDVLKSAGGGHKGMEQVLAAARQLKQAFPQAAAAVDPLIEKLKNAGKVKVKPKVEVDDNEALRKFDRINHGYIDFANKVDNKQLQVKVDETEAMTKLNKVKSKVADVNASKAKPVVTAETGQAMAHLIALQSYINSMHGKTITVTTVQATVGKHAYGGLIKGQGGPMSDMVPAMLSNGEYVMRAAAVSRYGVATLDSMNNGRWPWSPPTGGGGNGGGGADPGQWGKGSDANGSALLKKVIQALLGADLGPGVLRHLNKEFDKIQRQIARHHGKIDDDTKKEIHDLLKDIREAETERRKAIREAFKGLQADLADGAQAIQDEMASLRQSLREAGGVWNGALEHHAKQIVNLAHKYDATAKALEDQQAALEKMTSFVDEVTGNFDHSGFNTDQGLAGFFAQTTTDTVRANAFTTVLGQLKGLGLGGDAYEQLAKSGDLNTAQQLLAGGPGTIQAFIQAIANKKTALGTLGDQASTDLFGKTLDQQNRLIADTQATMARLQASVDKQEQVLRSLAGLINNVGTNLPRVKQGAYEGTYDGVKDALKGAGKALVRNGQ